MADLAQIIELLGDERYEKTREIIKMSESFEWFNTPNKEFDDQTPFDYLRETDDFSAYDDMLYQLGSGEPSN